MLSCNNRLMDKDPDHNDSVEFGMNGNKRDEPLTLSDLQELIDKEYFERSSSSDSRTDAKRYLKKAFVEKLFSRGARCELEEKIT